MNRDIIVGSHVFFTAQVVDAYEHKTHDINVIFEYGKDDEPYIFVGYYFGELDDDVTLSYIERYLANQ